MSTESETPQTVSAQDGPVQNASPIGIKQKIDEVEADGGTATENSTILGDDEDETSGGEGATKLARKVNPDGSVEQEDMVKYVISLFI